MTRLTEQILAHATGLPEGASLSAKSLLHLGNREAMDQALSRLTERGQLIRADRELANAVARHKSIFFVEKAADRTPIDYAAAVSGGLQLVPVGEGAGGGLCPHGQGWAALRRRQPFEALMERCADIAARVNRAGE